MNSWMKTPNLPSGVVTPRVKRGDVIGPIRLRGLFSVLNINISNCIKAQHYSTTITSTTTKTIQPKCVQEQIALPLFGNYVTGFCLCSRNLDKVFTLAKQTHFYRVGRNRACTIGHRWHMQYCTSILGHCKGFFDLLQCIRLLLKLSAVHVGQPRLEDRDCKISFLCFCIGYYWQNLAIIIINSMIYNCLVLNPLNLY